MHRNDDEPTTRPADPSRRPATEIRLGDVVAGKYRLESMLGVGGMGAVVRAHHLELDKPVALKVMHAELLAIEDASRRFALEARATATLKSPHAVRIIEIDRMPSGAPFIVMELLEGIDLGTMVRSRGPLSLERCVHYLLQATDAIAEAHRHHIVHRDLKPGNLFLTKEGIVKVVDFGLAKALDPGGAAAPPSSRTATNMLVGSPNYMAPEQIFPGGQVDARTDIWALGATLYQLLTGQPPFPAPSLAALVSRIATENPPRVTDRRSDVSPTVDAVIARCLRRNPDDRYRSVTAFQGSLLHLRAELQSASAREDAAATHGGTMPVTTRPVPHDAPTHPTLPPSTRPDPVDAVDPPSAPSIPAWAGDDEPTQVSGTTVAEQDPSDLASTRKL